MTPQQLYCKKYPERIRANRIKSDATADELMAVAVYAESGER
jgi:hypothetical protein